MKKKILFLTNRIPHNETAGGILYKNILKSYGIENFDIISISHETSYEKIEQDLKKINIFQFRFKIPNTNIIFKILDKLPLIGTLYTLIKRKYLFNRILSIIKKDDYRLIFAPLRGEVLLILNNIIEKTDIPVVSMLEDTVEREIDEGKKILFMIKKYNYYKVIPKIKKIGVVGETMDEYIKNKFNVPTAMIRLSFDNYSDNLKNINKNLNIFFSGNLYAKKEMLHFLDGLNVFSIANPHINITFYIASHLKIQDKRNRINIVNLGWIAETELIGIMKNCHISYLPYKSEKKFIHSMKYAFPSKAGFYISNNLPIFFHGPMYSSFNTFLRKYNVGISCDSLSKTDIEIKLTEFISSKSKYLEYQMNCKRAFEKEYNTGIFDRNVKELFDQQDD